MVRVDIVNDPILVDVLALGHDGEFLFPPSIITAVLRNREAYGGESIQRVAAKLRELDEQERQLNEWGELMQNDPEEAFRRYA